MFVATRLGQLSFSNRVICQWPIQSPRWWPRVSMDGDWHFGHARTRLIRDGADGQLLQGPVASWPRRKQAEMLRHR